jgi:hypothetical protein
MFSGISNEISPDGKWLACVSKNSGIMSCMSGLFAGGLLREGRQIADLERRREES